jgi:hypothetical protein
MAPELNRNLPTLIPNGQIIGFSPSTGGRPAYNIDWRAFEQMCKVQCTLIEISSILNVDLNTLEDAVQKRYHRSFSEVFSEKSSQGKASLRRQQYLKATVKDDTTMQIWLGKQWLGQTDKSINLNLTADLGNVPEEKKEAISRVLDALYDDDKV